MDIKPQTQNKRSQGQLSQGKAGLFAGILAYSLWGGFPIYFKLTASVSPLEILAHRVFWSLPFGALLIAYRHQWVQVWTAIKDRKTFLYLILAAILIAANWGIYIWAVQNDLIFQASLGYYINPLIFVVVGVVFLGDSLNRFQILAVILATIGVLVLTFYGGHFPFIAIVLALSFTIYGIIRKQINVGAMPGLFIEILVLFPFAVMFLYWLYHQGQMYFLSNQTRIDILLMLAGPITVVPLVAFSFAAKRLALSTIGFLQFIGPTGQFMLGLYYGEPLTPAHLICFSFIWLAVGFFVWGAYRKSRLTLASTPATSAPPPLD